MAEITARRQGELLAGVFQVLQKHPDGFAAKDVLRQVSEIVPPTPFEATYYPNRPGVRRYEKIIRFSTVPFVKAGWLVKTKGTWTATDEGLAAFDKAGPDVESWFRAAVAKYREWKKDQPEPDVVPDVNEAEIEEATARTTFEEATEAAFADIRTHVEAMSPYDFQDLVAALLEAIGYHALWVAPPGSTAGSTSWLVQIRLACRIPVSRFRSSTDSPALRTYPTYARSWPCSVLATSASSCPQAVSRRRPETKRVTTRRGDSLSSI